MLLSCSVCENIFKDILLSCEVRVQANNLKIEVHGHGTCLNNLTSSHICTYMQGITQAGCSVHGLHREKSRERSNKTTKINSGQQFRVHDGGVDVTPGQENNSSAFKDRAE